MPVKHHCGIMEKRIEINSLRSFPCKIISFLQLWQVYVLDKGGFHISNKLCMCIHDELPTRTCEAYRDISTFFQNSNIKITTFYINFHSLQDLLFSNNSGFNSLETKMHDCSVMYSTKRSFLRGINIFLLFLARLNNFN